MTIMYALNRILTKHVYSCILAVVEMIIVAKIYSLVAPVLDLWLGFSFEPKSILGHIRSYDRGSRGFLLLMAFIILPFEL